MNMAVDDRFLIEWKTDAALQVYEIEADRELLKRAAANLLQNRQQHGRGLLIVRQIVEGIAER